jgi:ribulose 1,5-bisphosphate synthetase/thiazole synthase
MATLPEIIAAHGAVADMLAELGVPLKDTDAQSIMFMSFMPSNTVCAVALREGVNVIYTGTEGLLSADDDNRVVPHACDWAAPDYAERMRADVRPVVEEFLAKVKPR